MNLRELEEWLSILIQHREDAAAGSRTGLARSYVAPERVANGEVVAPNDRMTALQRLDVYNNGYFARLREVLESDLPGVVHALGETRWRELALDYVEAHPSEHQNLNVFNRRMPEFLAGWHHPHREFLSDLASLEVMMTEAFDAPEFEPFDMQSLLHVAPERWAAATFETNPSLRLLRAEFPVNRYLQDLLDGNPPPSLATEVPTPAPTHLAIYRKDYQVWRLALPASMFVVLEALRDGDPLEQALAAAGDEHVNFQRWFQEWASDGLFTEVKL